MLSKIFITVLAGLVGVYLPTSPLQKYKLFNLIMDFLAAGGIG